MQRKGPQVPEDIHAKLPVSLSLLVCSYFPRHPLLVVIPEEASAPGPPGEDAVRPFPHFQPLIRPTQVPRQQEDNPVYEWHNKFVEVMRHGMARKRVSCTASCTAAGCSAREFKVAIYDT